MNEIKTKKPVPFSLIINVILIIAVVTLYFIYFNSGNDQPVKSSGSVKELPQISGKSDLSLAYVNTDVLLQEYQLVEKLMKQLEAESRKKDADLSVRQKELENEAAYFQESMQNNSLNEQSAQRIYEQLMTKQEEIYALQEQYAGELAQKEFAMNVTLLDSVRNYLNRLNVSNKYDYIMNYNASGSILIAKDTFDITDIVLEGLNMEYTAKYGAK
jgi:outer membrane protein